MSDLDPQERAALGLAAKEKGHWPRGVRRNEHDLPERKVRGVLDRLRRAVLETRLYSEPTYAAAARECGVDSRTIRRWVSGEDWPPKEAVLHLEKYLEHKRSK